MLFNTPVYLFFLLITVVAFKLLPKKKDKIFLLIASYVFYGYWDWRFLFLLVGSSLVDFYIGQRIYASDDEKRRKKLLQRSLLINLSLLGVFKYFNFFIDSFEMSFGQDLDFLHLNLLLPVGISFYTFQSLSYTFDIYRKKLKPTKSLLDYCLFVGVFPHMISGPIVKAVDLLPQLQKMRKPTKSDLKIGFSLITVGMFQKVLIGDTSAKFVDHIFANPSYYTSDQLLFSLFMFSIQIYADFSGYSKIARGSAKLLGINLIDNFNQPYLSTSITMFWKRWHISLSAWLKEYVYIWWLGGNRKGRFRTHFNLMATMLIGGLWHGANWTFIVWGGIHGIGLVINKTGNRISENTNLTLGANGQKIIKPFRIVLTFIIVVLAWLFFRAANFQVAWFYLDQIFVVRNYSAMAMELLVIAVGFSIPLLLIDLIEVKHKKHEFLMDYKPAIRYGIVIPVWTVILLYLYTVGKPMPFIYFQF